MILTYKPTWRAACAYYSMMLLVAGLLQGCSDRGGEKTPAVQQRVGNCRVVVYMFRQAERPDERVVVSWDGETVYNDKLPVRELDFTGHPLRLLEIQTSPGDHVMEASFGGVRGRIKVRLGDEEVRYLMITGAEEGQGVPPISDLGNDPMFL